MATTTSKKKTSRSAAATPLSPDDTAPAARKTAPRKTAASKPAAPAPAVVPAKKTVAKKAVAPVETVPAKAAAPKTATAKRATAKTAAAKTATTKTAATKTAPAPAAAPKTAARKAPAAAPAPATALARAIEPPPARKAATKKTAPAETIAKAEKAEKAEKVAAPAKRPPAEKAAAKQAAAPAAAEPGPVAAPGAAVAAVEATAARQQPSAKKAAAKKTSAKGEPAPAPKPAPKPAHQSAPKPAPRPAPAAPRRADVERATAPAAPAAAPVSPPPPAVPAGPAHSEVVLLQGDLHRIAWRPGQACPPALREAAAQRLDDEGFLRADDDAALPTLLRLAVEARHALRVDDAVWAQLAADRDARHRLQALEAAYPDGPASADLQQLLRVGLPQFQAEGALFAAVAGRALIADERGLGKSVQAIAAAELGRRHFGLRRVLLLCAPAQRAAWQRAWRRFAGREAQVMDGGLHQRQALWSTEAELRILAPEALASDAAHVEHWAPELVIVDEPQRLDGWATLQAPQALVLCGAPLADEPALLDALVDWLDLHRQGPLAALRRIQAARERGQTLADDEVARLGDQLSRLLLQRERSEVAEQLPAQVWSERLLPLAPAQREAHDRLRAQLQRGLAGWQASGWLSDAEQWRLGGLLRALRQACHRADPADPASPLAEATLQALVAQLDEWAEAGAQRVAVVCEQAADRALIAARLAPGAAARAALGLAAPDLLLDDEPLPPGTEAVLQIGVPWRPRRAERDAPRGQQWQLMVAQDSVEGGLFETLALRADVPRGPADGGGRAYLYGERLTDWLRALQAALAAA